VTVRSKLGALFIVLATVAAAHEADARPDDPTKTRREVDPATRDKSRAAFRRGVAQLRSQDWAAARASFEEAWSLVQHPSILLNLGIARLRTDDPVLAEQDLVRFLSEDSGAGTEELSSARDALTEARSKIGTMRVVVDKASARVFVDGKPIGVQAAPTGKEGIAEARLKAGSHRVGVEAEGFLADERSVELPPKSATEVKFVLVAKEGAKPPSTQVAASGSRTRTIVGWSLAAGSGVALLASGVMGLSAMSHANAYEDRTDRASFQNPDVKSEGIAFRTGADIALVTAVLAGAGAAILLLTDIGASPAGQTAPPTPGTVLGLRPNQWGDPTDPQRSAAPTLVQVSGGTLSGVAGRAGRFVRLTRGTLIDW
jgi:hypothetical protein